MLARMRLLLNIGKDSLLLLNIGKDTSPTFARMHLLQGNASYFRTLARTRLFQFNVGKDVPPNDEHWQDFCWIRLESENGLRK